MASVKIPARDMIFQVLAADGTTYLTVGAMNSFTVNPAEDEEITDVTTFDSDGSPEKRKMQVGASISMEGFLLKDSVTGVQDGGQARIETLHASFGEDSLGAVRFRHPMDTVWKKWNAVFSIGEQGGGNNDETSWSATVTRSGASTTEAV